MASNPGRAGRLARAGARGAAACIVLASCSTPRTPTEPPIDAVRVRPFEVRGAVEQSSFVGSVIAAALKRNLEIVPGLQVLADDTPAAAGAVDLEGTFRRGDAESCLDVSARRPGLAQPLWTASRCSDVEPLPDLIQDVALACLDAMRRTPPKRYPFIGRIEGGPEMAASPLMAEARKRFFDLDGAGLSEVATQLVERFPTEPGARAFEAWAMMLRWDEEPSANNLSALKDALDALRRADVNNPYGDVIQAYVYRSSGAPDEARQLYTRVLERKDLTPAAHSWVLRQRSFTYLQAGKSGAARLDAEEAVRLDPANGIALVALSKALEADGDLPDALARAREAVALEPGSWRDLQRVGIVAALARSYDQAADFLGRACDLADNQEACANFAVVLQRAGRGEEALRIAVRAEKRPASRWGAYNLACVWALRGDRDATLAALRRAFALGFADVAIATDPDLRSMRDDPGFKAEVKRVLERIRVRRDLATAVFPWQG